MLFIKLPLNLKEVLFLYFLIVLDYSLENIEKIFNFLQEAEKLKSTLRYCHTTSGRKESTAEHSWRLALMSFMIAEELKLDLDLNRVMKIALVHDLAEALTWDIDAILVANGEVTKEEKERQEIEAMKKIQATLPDSLWKSIFDLWNEYNEAKTKEAIFMKALDKLETSVQFEETGYEIYDNHEYIAIYPDKHVKKVPELLGFLKELKKRLKVEFEKWGFEWRDEYDVV